MRNARDSGLPWLAEIPQHWDVSRLKFETTHIVDCLHATPPYDPEGEFPAIRTSDVEPGRLLLHQAYRLTTENYLRWTERLVPVEGDILYTREGERFGIAACVPTGVRLCISQRMMLFRIRPDRDSSYFMWQLNARHVYEQAAEDQVGAAAPHVNVEKIQNFRLLVPPLDEQREIVERIARETSRIDALVAAKQRLLDLLVEKRKAIIATAVTRGLDPKVKLRDSGVPWLGEIPSHWESRRAKYLFRQSALPVTVGDEIVTCFRDGQVTLRRNRREEGFTNADLEVGYQGIRQGQLVLHSMDAFAGAIGVSDSNGRCSPEYIICDPFDDSRIVPEYFGSLLRTMALAGFIQASCPAVRERAPRIRFNDFGEMYLPVPPSEEQRAIVEHIARETAKLDAVRAATERTIALLKERRSALIAAAVTGQLDVGAA